MESDVLRDLDRAYLTAVREEESLVDPSSRMTQRTEEAWEAFRDHAEDHGFCLQSGCGARSTDHAYCEDHR